MSQFNEDLVKEQLIELRSARQAQRANIAASKMDELHGQLRSKAREEADRYHREAEGIVAKINWQISILKVAMRDTEGELLFDESDIELKLRLNTLMNQLHDTQKQLDHADRI